MLIADLEDVAAAAGQAAVTFVIATDPEAPAGFVEGQGGPRAEAPRFTYHGLGEPHWRGQPCYSSSDSATHPDERIVTMACGCRASVPWWTLQLLSGRR